MGSYLYIVLIITLVFVILAQAVERFFYGQQYQKEQSRLLAAILSKNATEYKEVLKTEKIEPAKPQIESDEVELSQADDETFQKFIERQTT